jgi:anti-repressor protein
MKSKNQIKQFHSDEFGEIRVLEIEGEPWFVGADIAGALGYEKPRNALIKHVDGDDALKRGIIDSMGRTQQTTLINESGLYSLILSSKLPSAKRFKRWVTSEVLPTIRKHGAYATHDTLDELLRSPKFAERLIQRLEEEREKSGVLEGLATEMAPKALYCDMVLQCANLVPVSLIAKDYGMSAAAFNTLLYAIWVSSSRWLAHGFCTNSTQKRATPAPVPIAWAKR